MKHVFIISVVFFTFLQSSAQGKIDSATTRPDTLATITDSSNYATLYVYRQPHWGGAHLSYDLYMEDAVICRVRNDSKYIIRVYKEGNTMLWAKTERKATKEIIIQFGKDYYLKCDVSKFGVFVMSPVLQLMYEEYGKFDFKGVDGKNSKMKD
jgi:hypothetical protein